MIVSILDTKYKNFLIKLLQILKVSLCRKSKTFYVAVKNKYQIVVNTVNMLSNQIKYQYISTQLINALINKIPNRTDNTVKTNLHAQFTEKRS